MDVLKDLCYSNEFRTAKKMYEITESTKGDKGEVSRVSRRLAEALELDGQVDEAQKLKLEAEDIRKEMQGERFANLPDTEHSYNLLVCMNYW